MMKHIETRHTLLEAEAEEHCAGLLLPAAGRTQSPIHVAEQPATHCLVLGVLGGQAHDGRGVAFLDPCVEVGQLRGDKR